MFSTKEFREEICTMDEGGPLSTDKLPDLFMDGSSKEQVHITQF